MADIDTAIKPLTQLYAAKAALVWIASRSCGQTADGHYCTPATKTDDPRGLYCPACYASAALDRISNLPV